MGCVFSGSLSRQPGAAERSSVLSRVFRPLAVASGNLRDDLLTTTFPEDCRICGRALTAWSRAPVCRDCVAAVQAQRDALCGCCGEALGMESARFAAAQGADAQCTACRLVPPAFTRAVAYAAYESETRDLLHLLKYERMRSLADEPLGRWLAAAMAHCEPEAARNVLVTAVPLWTVRERQRGFNQSVLLADAAMRQLRRSHPRWVLRAAHALLERTRDTEAQFSLQPRARRRNVRGAFRVAKGSVIDGLEVLLVDDIMTTGATARECARVLLRAGAAKVWVATVARAQAETVALHFTGKVARWGEA